MTGTAQTAAPELRELYGLEVVVVPTHRPMIRVDHPDVVFTHREAKERAVVDEIQRVARDRTGRCWSARSPSRSRNGSRRGFAAPASPARFSTRRTTRGRRRSSRAPARLGAVTISTNMAGRGTDIRLGGEDEAEHDRVAALGGLYVIGTNRHESRRVDLQLRGRAGRQGDPGESRFFVSLEDDLLVRYGIDALIAGRVVTGQRDEPLDHPVLRAEIARAQRIIEGQNVEIRKTLWRYASVIEGQRRHVMDARQAILHGERGAGRLEAGARAPTRAGRRGRRGRRPRAPSGR